MHKQGIGQEGTDAKIHHQIASNEREFLHQFDEKTQPRLASLDGGFWDASPLTNTLAGDLARDFRQQAAMRRNIFKMPGPGEGWRLASGREVCRHAGLLIFRGVK